MGNLSLLERNGQLVFKVPLLFILLSLNDVELRFPARTQVKAIELVNSYILARRSALGLEAPAQSAVLVITKADLLIDRLSDELRTMLLNGNMSRVYSEPVLRDVRRRSDMVRTWLIKRGYTGLVNLLDL